MIRTLKSLILNTHPTLSKREFLTCVVIIFIGAYFFAPKFWEPGGESLKNWVSAQIFMQTGGFPVLHHTPLYNLYLQLFLFFDYPLSIQLEHFITHLFTYISIFLLINRFLPIAPAMLLTCSWIPVLWVTEGGARVAGIGFLALYFQAGKPSYWNAWNKGYFPVSLGAAALLDLANIPFLLGHIIGNIIKRRFAKEPIVAFRYRLNRADSTSVLVKALMVLLVVLTISFQSKRPDNNVNAILYPWAPFPQKEILTIANLAFGNAKYVHRNVAKSEWIYQDWYFTNEKAFGGASTILGAMLNNPNAFFLNIFKEVLFAIETPLNFIVGFSFPKGALWLVILFLSWALLPICFYRAIQYFKANNLIPHFYSIVFGVSSVITSLLLTRFSSRYAIVLLPVGLLIACHIGTSLQFLLKFMRTGVSRKSNNTSNIDAGSKEHKIIFILGVLLIFSGFIANEWVLTALLPKPTIAGLSSKIPIWVIDVFLVVSGILIIIYREIFSEIIRQIKDSSYSNKQSWFTNAIVLLMAGCILFTSNNQFDKLNGINNLLVNPFLLYGRMTRVHPELLKSVDKTSKVLAYEEPWIRSFADVDLDKVFHPLFLPPFKKSSGETEKFLDSLDVIWVSNEFERREASVATQIYLRYYLHVEPFLKKALENGWTVRNIEGFGKIYRRSISR